MASTYTASLSLEKQASGEGSNTWGTLLNTVLDNIDTAIAGYLAKSVAGSSDVTLTAAEALNATIQCTGALTGNINVIVPTVEQRWTFHNGTSGAFTLTVKTSAGTGIVVPQGEKMDLYCDGTNVVIGAPTAFLGTVFTLVDPTDTTKKARFSAAGITGTNTRTFTLPDGNVTFASLAGTETFTNKRMTAPTITDPTYIGTATGTMAGGTYAAPAIADPNVSGTATGTMVWTGPQRAMYGTIGEVAPGGTATVNFTTRQNWILTMTSTGTTTRLLANPTNPVAGQSGVLEFVQPAGGNAHLNWGAGYKFAGTASIALSSGANQRDVIPYAVLQTGTHVVLSSLLNIA